MLPTKLVLAALASAVVAIAAMPPWIATTGAQPSELQPRGVIPMVTSDRPFHPVEQPLLAAEKEWERLGIEDYTMTVVVSRFGPSERHIVTVEDGELAAIESECTLGAEPYPCEGLGIDSERFTVDGLFAFIHERLLKTSPYAPGPDDFPGAVVLEARFGVPGGLPLSISWGLDRVLDSGEFIRIEAFSAADPAEDLAFARARWEANEPYEYSTGVQFWNRLDVRHQTAHVLDGAVVESAAECFEEEGAPGVPCEVEDPAAPTPPGLFALVEKLLATPGTIVHVIYDVADGRVLFVEWGPQSADPRDWPNAQPTRFDPLH